MKRREWTRDEAAQAYAMRETPQAFRRRHHASYDDAVASHEAAHTQAMKQLCSAVLLPTIVPLLLLACGPGVRPGGDAEADAGDGGDAGLEALRLPPGGGSWPRVSSQCPARTPAWPICGWGPQSCQVS